MPNPFTPTVMTITADLDLKADGLPQMTQLGLVRKAAAARRRREDRREWSSEDCMAVELLAARATIRALEAERDEARTNAASLSDIMACISAERNEAVRGRMALEAERDAMREALAAKAKDQVAYWRQKQVGLKTLEDGHSEDGETYTPIGDQAAWRAGHANGRYSEANWWQRTIAALVHPMAETEG